MLSIYSSLPYHLVLYFILAFLALFTRANDQPGFSPQSSKSSPERQFDHVNRFLDLPHGPINHALSQLDLKTRLMFHATHPMLNNLPNGSKVSTDISNFVAALNHYCVPVLGRSVVKSLLTTRYEELVINIVHPHSFQCYTLLLEKIEYFPRINSLQIHNLWPLDRDIIIEEAQVRKRIVDLIIRHFGHSQSLLKHLTIAQIVVSNNAVEKNVKIYESIIAKLLLSLSDAPELKSLSVYEPVESDAARATSNILWEATGKALQKRSLSLESLNLNFHRILRNNTLISALSNGIRDAKRLVDVTINFHTLTLLQDRIPMARTMVRSILEGIKANPSISKVDFTDTGSIEIIPNDHIADAEILDASRGIIESAYQLMCENSIRDFRFIVSNLFPGDVQTLLACLRARKESIRSFALDLSSFGSYAIGNFDSPTLKLKQTLRDTSFSVLLELITFISRMKLKNDLESLHLILPLNVTAAKLLHKILSLSSHSLQVMRLNWEPDTAGSDVAETTAVFTEWINSLQQNRIQLSLLESNHIPLTTDAANLFWSYMANGGGEYLHTLSFSKSEYSTAVREIVFGNMSDGLQRPMETYLASLLRYSETLRAVSLAGIVGLCYPSIRSLIADGFRVRQWKRYEFWFSENDLQAWYDESAPILADGPLL